ncbi:WcbI family polysaccharide biosynthesis putative acetyltransferase [Solidesulfovibrio sp.]
MLQTLRREVTQAAQIVGQYLAVETHVGGGMHPKAAQLWGYLLAIQNANSISGDFVEIGVFKGWGSFLPSRYCRPTEKLVLVDISQYHIDLARAFLVEHAGAKPEQIETVLTDSASGGSLAGLFNPARRLRFAHIDGEHSYSAVLADLDAVAGQAMADAVLCVDDVDHALAPGINDAMLDWLARNKTWRLLLRGYNKAYLVSQRSRIPWNQYIDFLPDVFATYFSSSILLASQTQSAYTTYFSYGEPFNQNKYLKVNQTVLGLEEFEGVHPRSLLCGESCKPSFLVFGNCQMRVVHGALVAAAELCGLDVRFDYVADVHELEAGDPERLRELARQSHGMICQNVQGERFLVRTAELAELLREKWRITVPSMHFNAYWPNQGDLQLIAGSPQCMPVDAVIYQLVENGRSNEEILAILHSPDLYQPAHLTDWFEKAVSRLRDREAHEGLTVRIADFLAAQARSQRLFYIFNHPKKTVLDFVLRRLLQELSQHFQPRRAAICQEILTGQRVIPYDMSSIDFVDILPLPIVCQSFGLSYDAREKDVYRYFRPRGACEIHKIITVQDEIAFIRSRLPSLDAAQRSFNRSQILSTTCLTAYHERVPQAGAI